MPAAAARRPKRPRQSPGLAIFAAGVIVAAAFLARVALPDTLTNLSNLVFDAYQRAVPRPWTPELPVRIVDIDEASLARLGQWPWPRDRLAAVAEFAQDAGAAAIVFDFLFAEPDRTSPEEVLTTLSDTPARRALAKALELSIPHDISFASALGETGSVLAAALTQKPGGTLPVKAGYAVAGDDPTRFIRHYDGATPPLDVLAENAKGIGAINWLPDRDQVIRRVPMVLAGPDGFVPTLAAEALRVAQGASTYVLRASNASGETAFGATTGLNAIRIGGIEVPTDPNGAVVVRYSEPAPGRYIPAWKILAGEVPEEELKGRIVLVGTSAAGLFDLRATPVAAVVPGIEVHAQVIEHIVSGGWLARPDWAPGLEIVAAVLGALFSAIVVAKLPVRAALPVALSLSALFCLASWFAFTREGLFIDPVFPAGTALGALFAASATVIFTKERARREIRHAFSRYLAPDLVDEVAADPARLKLGGEMREMTLLFSDIRGFTTLSEGMEAETLTRFLNAFLTPMTDVILSRRGTIDKYMGDAVMAFWNAPVDDPDHASNASGAALDMLAALTRFNAGHEGTAKVAIGIGINTGECCVGNLGSEQRFDYSVIGDDVNVASRLEGLTKFYGVPILAGEATAAAARGYEFLELDRVRVKGKKTALTVSALLGDAGIAGEIDLDRLREAQAAMLDAYRARDWDAALSRLAELPALSGGRLTDYAAAMEYRIARLRTAALPDDWDGVFDPESK